MCIGFFFFIVFFYELFLHLFIFDSQEEEVSPTKKAEVVHLDGKFNWILKLNIQQKIEQGKVGHSAWNYDYRASQVSWG